MGAARNWPVNSDSPADEGIVVFWNGRYGHVGYYWLDGDWLVLLESNYTKCTVTHGRRVHKNDWRIKGFDNNK